MANVDDYIEKRKKQMGITSEKSASNQSEQTGSNDYIQKRKMDLGLIPDTRPKQKSPFEQAVSSGSITVPNIMSLENTPRIQQAKQYAEEHPKVPPTFGGALKKSASRLVEGVSAPFEALSNAPVVRNVGGGMKGLTNPQQYYENPYPDDGTHLGAYKNLAGGLVTAAKNYGRSIYEGAVNPKETKKRFDEQTSKISKELDPVTGTAFNFIAQAGTDPVSFIPIPAESIARGTKFAGTKIGDALNGLFKRSQSITPEAEQSFQKILALPAAGETSGAKRLMLREGTIPSGDVIHMPGNIYEPPTLALPEGNYVQPQRLRAANGNETIDFVMNKIKPEVEQAITPPARRDLLIDYVQKHLDVPKEEVWNMPMSDLKDLGQQIRSNISVYDVATQTAAKHGYDLPKLFEGKSPSIGDRVAQDAQKRAYGVYPEQLPNVKTPQFNRQVVSEAAAPMQKVGFKSQTPKPTPQFGVEIIPPNRNLVGKTTKDNQNLQSKIKPEQTEEILQTKEPRIRDKIYSTLDDAEKAARERLKAKRNTLSSLPLDQYADHAIILAAKLGKGTIKLADATELLVKEFGESIRPHAAAIYNKAKGIVQETERRATKEAQDARSFNVQDTGDASTFSGKVSRGGNDAKVPFSKRMEKWRSQFVDDLAPLENVEKRIRGKVSSAEDSLYKSGRLFRGVPEKANQIVKERLAPIINGIEKKGYTSSDLGDYALAMHAKDVNARDIKSGFTNKEIEDTIQKLGTPEMEAARKELIKINDDMLGELAKRGVISWDLVGVLRERYPNYMPLFRAFDDESVNFADGLSKALANVTSPIKGLKGSERQVIDPLENMVKNIFQSTNAAERNKVAQQLSKLAKEDKDAAFIRKLDDGEEVGRKNVVSVLEGGKKVQYEVEQEVYKAMLNLDQEASNMLIKVLQKPASLLRAGATLTPEFSLRNPMRDVLQAFVTSESGFNPITDFGVGLIQSISKGKLYQKWVDELGSFGNMISNDRKVHQEALERVLKESPGKKFVNILNGKSLINLLRKISDTTESATKVGEFRAALRSGATPQEAAYRSRDVMDFGRSGSSIKQANKIVAFLNANIQGKSKLIRAFKANPAGFTARAFASMTVPTIGVFLMQKYTANDEQKKIISESPQWLRDTFWLVPVPGTNQVARIPKPFDIGAIFANIPEKALDYTFNNDKEAFDGFAKKAMADAALPGMISGLIPFIEGMANYSFFRQSNIIPRGEDARNYEDQYDVNTTESAKLLAKGANTLTGGKGAFKNFSSPRIMDNTIKGLTAGLGTYATSAIDVLLDKFNITDNPDRPAKGAAQKPLAKAFLVNPLQSGKSSEKLYELKDELTREKGSAALRKEPFKDEGKLKFIEGQTKAMGDISALIRNIEKDRNLSAKEKRDKIEPLLKQKNDIAITGMNRLKKQQ